MKFVNKTIRLSAIAAVAVIGLAACQQKDKTDLFAVDSDLAQKTLLGIYVGVQVDTANMNTTLYEWKLENGDAGRVGLFKLASTGNGLDASEETSLTWSEAVMSDDKLSFTIPVVINGQEKNLLWRDGVIETDGYVTTKQVISMADALRTINNQFANFDFVYNDTVNYVTVSYDTVPYLAWETQVVEWSTEQIEAYKAELLGMVDTIAWFNANFPPEARGATSEIPDTVRFATKPLVTGLFRGLVPVSHEDTIINSESTVHGPLTIVNSELVCNRSDAKVNTGSYSYRVQTWNDEFYKNPDSKKALHTDSAYVMSDAKWTPSAFTNVKKFVVSLKGNEKVTVDGKETSKAGAIIDLPLQSFESAKGTVEINGLKYELK